MIKMKTALSTLLLLAAPFAALADKDSDFYYSGFVNPNIKKKMYWKDAYNVLEDLDQFSALYITYHNCAHSLYPTNPGSGEDEDNEGYEFWYRNSFPQFLANGAYSLYGILSSGSNGEKGGTMCHRGTYINSFFTNRGVETLAYPFGIVDYNGDVPTSQCEGGDAEASYGLGCYNGTFVYGQFDGGSCGGDIQSVSDYLETFNANMEALECVQIYGQSSSSSKGDDTYGDDAYAATGDDVYANDGYVAAYGGDDAYNDDGNDYGGRQRRRQEDNEEGDEGGEYNQYVDADPLDILAYSESCSIELYGPACPDPFRIKKGYERDLRRSLKIIPSAYGGNGKQAIQIVSLVFLALGAVLFYVASIVRKMPSECLVNDKEDALIATTPLKKPRSLIHSTSKKAGPCKLKKKFQDFAQEEFHDGPVFGSHSKDDSYIQLNNDSPTDEETPAFTPSKEKPIVEPATEFHKGPVFGSHSKDDSYIQLKNDSPTEEDQPAQTPSPGKPVGEPSESAVFYPSSPALAEPTSISTQKKKKKKRPWLNKISKTVFGDKDSSV